MSLGREVHIIWPSQVADPRAQKSPAVEPEQGSQGASSTGVLGQLPSLFPSRSPVHPPVPLNAQVRHAVRPGELCHAALDAGGRGQGGCILQVGGVRV